MENVKAAIKDTIHPVIKKVAKANDSNFMRIGNLCVTRKNMGDSLMLPIPYTVSVAQAGSEYCYSQSQKCCWKGETTSKYNSENGGYSGCTRTVCNREAANEICAKFNYAGKTWRLPTPEEGKNFALYTASLGGNGLMLCTNGVVDSAITAQCSYVENCKGSYQNACVAYDEWRSEFDANTAYITNYDRGVYWPGGTISKSRAASVRCVTEMN